MKKPKHPDFNLNSPWRAIQPIRGIILLLLLTGLTAFSSTKLLGQTTSWKGTVNTNWSSSANWTNGAPTSTMDVIIGDENFTGPYQPNLSGISSCRSLTIGNGAIASELTSDRVLTIEGDLVIGNNGSLKHVSNSITVKGNWTNHGSYTTSQPSATVVLAGSSQSISGSTTFRKLTTDAASSVSLQSNIAVTANFTVNGTFDPNTYLVTLTGSLFSVNAGASIKVKGATFASNFSINPTLSTTSTVDYASSSINQTVATLSYGTLKISGGTTKSLAGNTVLQSSSSLAGNVIIDAGTLHMGTYTLHRGTSTAGGSFTIANNASLLIGGTNSFPANYADINLATNSTVEYGGTNQTVSNLAYGNLALSSSSGAAVKTLPSTALTIANNFTSAVGSGTSVSFTAGNAITVNGNLSIGASTTFIGGSYTHTVGGHWTNNGTYTASTGTVVLSGTNKSIGGSNSTSFNNLTISGFGITSGVNITVTGNFSTTGAGKFTHQAGSTFTLSGSSKIISGSDISFHHLTISGTISTASSFVVGGNLVVNGTLNGTNGTIEMTGASTTISGSGTLSFYGIRITGTVSTVMSFTIKSDLMGVGKLTATAGTITFSGTTAYAGSHDLFNVTLNGTRLQLGANATLGIGGAFTINAGTFDVSTTKPNTVSFNGSGAQTITSTTYSNLTLAGGNTKTAGGNLTANHFTISSGVTFQAGSYTHTINGNWINQGTLSAGTSTIQLTGSFDATVSGSNTFYVLTINKNSTSNFVGLSNSFTVGTLNMTSGELRMGNYSVTITNTRTGNGLISGTVIRTHTFSAGVSYAFSGPYNTVTFNTIVGSVSSVSATITSATQETTPLEGGINRIYNFSVTSSGTYIATLRLQYQDSELSGNTESALELYRYTSSWVKSGKWANDAANNWVENTLLTNLNGKWTLSNDNTIAIWKGTTSSNWQTASNWKSGVVPSSDDIIQIGTESFTHQPVISSSITAKMISFGSVQPAVLSLASNGALSVSGNVQGSWTSDAAHTIDIGSGTMTVGGDLIQGPNQAGRAIHLALSTGSLTVNGWLIQATGANISFAGAGSLNLNGNFINNGGTFNAGNGTVTYSGAASQTIAAVTYNHLSINKTAGSASIISPLTVNGNLTLSTGGVLDVNANLTVAGNVTVGSGVTMNENGATISVGGNWSQSGTFNPTTGTTIFNGTGDQAVSATTFNRVTINKASGAVNLTGNWLINGHLTLAQGTLDLGTFTANRSIIGGTLTVSSGTTLRLAGASNFPAYFNTRILETASTVEYYGTVAQTIYQVPYGNLVLKNGTKTVSGPLTIENLDIEPGASFSPGANTLTINGDFINLGSFNASSSTLVLTGTNKTLSGSTQFNHLVITGSYTSTAGTDLVISGNIDLSGSYSAGNNSVTVEGNLLLSGSYFSDGITTFAGNRTQTIQLTGAIYSPSLNGVVEFAGSVAPIFNSTSSPVFANLRITNTGTIQPSMGWTVLKDFYLAPGSTFNGGSLTHRFIGSFENQGNIFSNGQLYFTPAPPYVTAPFVEINLGAESSFESSGTVTFGGSSQIVFSGMEGFSSAFNNVIISNTHPSGISLTTDWTVEGELTIHKGSVLHGGDSLTHTLKGDLRVAGYWNGGNSTFVVAPADSVSTISGSGEIVFNHLQISGNTSVINDIRLLGDLINHSLINFNEATAYFSGTRTSHITGSTQPTSLSKWVVAKENASVILAVDVDNISSLSIESGTLSDQGRALTQLGASGMLSISNGARLKIEGTNTLPVFNQYQFATESTVEYAGGIQAVAVQSYGNLEFSNAGTKSLQSGTTQANNLINYSTLTQPDEAILQLRGHWTNNGTFHSNNSTIEFIGNATQNLLGSSVTQFNNITVSNTAVPGVSVESNQELKGVLQLGAHVMFDADGSGNNTIFTLLSTGDNPTEDASVGQLPVGAQVSGKVTVQRFMTKEGGNNTNIYRYISAPVKNATVADLQNEIPVSGNFIGRSPGYGKKAGLFEYDETVITDLNKDKKINQEDGYRQFPKANNAEKFAVGRGYSLFVRGSKLTSTKWDLRGEINAANEAPINFPVTYTSSGNIEHDGWNLVGNPFPATIDWNASAWTKENIDQTIYLRDNGTVPARYAYWNGVVGINGGSRYIASGQAFWVKANGTGTPVLTATEAVKEAGRQTTFFRTGEAEITNLLRIKLSKGTLSDETVVHFREGATEAFDSFADAMKLANSTMNVSTLLANGTRLAINSLPPLNCLYTLKLAVEQTPAGNYRFDFSELETFPAGVTITLKDKFLNKTHVVTMGGSYTFAITSNTASYGTGRFELTFSSQGPKSDFLLSAASLCEGMEGTIQIANSEAGIQYTAWLNNQAITNAVSGNGSTVAVALPASALTAGPNNITIKANSASCSVAAEKMITVNVAKVYRVTSVKDGIACGLAAITLKASGAPSTGKYYWYNAPDATNFIKGFHSDTFITPLIAESKTYYVSIANEMGCEGPRVPVKANVVTSITTQIQVNGMQLTSSWEYGNQWYFNNEIMPGATTQSIEAQKTGVYKVVTTLNTCTASAEIELAVTDIKEKSENKTDVYPNPVVDKVHIKSISEYPEQWVYLLNGLGQVLVVKQATPVVEGEQYCEIEMQQLPAGIYFIRLVNAGGKTDYKIIKQ
jgi:hypothetical protein